MTTVEGHRIVSREEWLAERTAFLAEEKAFTKARDALSRRRLELPWVRIDKAYGFDGPDGRETLADLFDGRSQLIVQHFMFGPDWTEGCVGCSFNADHADGALPHLRGRDVAFAAVSRAPVGELEKYRKRMGWQFKWVSSLQSDFNFDLDVSFRKEDVAAGKATYNFKPYDGETEDLSGYSSFYRNAEGEIFHATSVYARGDEILCTAYMYLDLLAPLGRNESGLEYPMAWWRHHDKYEDTRGERKSCCA